MATVPRSARHQTTSAGFSHEHPAPGTACAAAVALEIYPAMWEPITHHEERDVITAFHLSVQSEM